MSKYLLHYDEISHLDINDNEDQINKFIKSIPGKKISELSFKDLVYDGDKPLYRGVGVYIFKSEDTNYYVGSCVSRSFIERIPAHLDIRYNGWFNSLLKNIIKKDPDRPIDDDEACEKAARLAFKKINLIIINFNYQHAEYESLNIRQRIINLERRIGNALIPYNGRNGKFPKPKEI